MRMVTRGSYDILRFDSARMLAAGMQAYVCRCVYMFMYPYVCICMCMHMVMYVCVYACARIYVYADAFGSNIFEHFRTFQTLSKSV